MRCGNSERPLTLASKFVHRPGLSPSHGLTPFLRPSPHLVGPNGLLEGEERMIGMVFCLACIEVLARMNYFTLGSSPYL